MGGSAGLAIGTAIANMIGDGDGSEDNDHYQERREQANSGDSHRQVGDPNRVIREGKKYLDTETGNNVYVRGDRVVIENSKGKLTQFKNPKANTINRIQKGRWVPVE